MHNFDGPFGVLAHAFLPPPNGASAAGDVHFDRAENWTCDTSGLDIGVVMIHELGHSIGLNHENTNLAIMQPAYNPDLFPTVQDDDINGAVAIYGGLGGPVGDPDDSLTEAGRTGYGITVVGEIDNGEDVDIYAFEAYPGQVFEIDIDTPVGFLDSYLRIFDSTGTQLTFDDDTDGPLPEFFSLESFLTFTPPVAGTYYVGVSAFNNFNYNPLDGSGDVPAFSTGEYEMIIRPTVELASGLAVGGDRAGFAVAVSGDWAAVGVRLADPLGLNGAGAVDMYQHNGNGTWSFYERLLDLNPTTGAHFGHAVSLSGTSLAIGAEASSTNGFRGGNLSVRTFDGSNWVPGIDINPLSPGDRFGRSVGIDGNNVIAGAPNNDNLGSRAGSATILIFGVNILIDLFASDASAQDNFGNSVAISGDYAVVGSFRDDDGGSSTGSAYVFYKDQGGTDAWGQVAKLVASDAAVNDQFGFFVDISGDTIVIGSRLSDVDATTQQTGAVYVFDRDPGANTWSEVQKVFASDALPGDRLGTSVAIDGDRFLAGAPDRDDFGDDSGKVYSFARDSAGVWQEVAQLFNDETTTRDEFGVGVALDGHNAVVGSWLDNRTPNNTGGAYMFGL